MRDKTALFIGLCAGLTGTTLAYVYPAFSPVRLLWYYPLAHR